MSLRINTNVGALNAYSNLSTNQANLQDAFEKLSSGLRINKAADDAAGLSISQGLTSADQRSDPGRVATPRTAPTSPRSPTARWAPCSRSCSACATWPSRPSNGGSQDSRRSDRDPVRDHQPEHPAGQHLQDHRLRWHQAAGRHLHGRLPGRREQQRQRAADPDADLVRTPPPWDRQRRQRRGTTAGAQQRDQPRSTRRDRDGVGRLRSQIGATQNQLGYTITNLQTTIQNVTASRSNITDADLATEVTAMSQAQILTSAATSVLAQANSAPQAILKLLQ